MTGAPCRHRLDRVAWPRRVAMLALAAAALGAWWHWLAPSQLGGPVTLAVVHGTSMEPLLHTNDLVVAYRATDYNVGDVVVFHQYGGTVAHVLRSGAAATGWQTHGINNSWDDSWTLTGTSILGRAVYVSPTAGAAAVWVHEHPLGWALIIAAAAAAVHAVRRPRQQVAVARHRCETPECRALQALCVTGLVVSLICAAAVVAQPNAPPRALVLSLSAVLVAAGTTAVVARLSGSSGST